MSHADQSFEYPFKPGDLVSTEKRFRNKDEYIAAVQVYGADQYNPRDHSYSVELCGDMERLLLYQPSRNYPADCGDILFRYSPEPSLLLFQQAYEHKTKYQGYKEVEYPGNGFRGKNDRFNTYRALLLPPDKQQKRAVGADYEGYIINPPYPRKINKRRNTFAGTAKYIIGGLGIGVTVFLAIKSLGRSRR